MHFLAYRERGEGGTSPPGLQPNETLSNISNHVCLETGANITIQAIWTEIVKFYFPFL